MRVGGGRGDAEKLQGPWAALRPRRAALESLAYAGGNYVAQVSNAVTNLLISGILGPAGAGALTWIFALERYVNLAPAPLRSALEREVPRLAGDKLGSEAPFVDNAAFQNLLLTLVGSVVLLVAGFYAPSLAVRSGCHLMAAFNLIRGVADFSRIYQKALLRFRPVTVILVATGLVLPAAALPLGIRWGLDGYFVGRGVALTVAAGIAVLWLPRIPRLRWDAARPVLRATFVVGLPMLVYGLTTTLLVTLDRFAVEHWLTLEDLGHYGIGSIFMQALLLLPVSMCGAYFPRYMARPDRGRQRAVERLTGVVAMVTGLAAVAGWIAIPLVVHILLPEFVPGIEAARIQLLVAFYLGIGQLYYFEVVRQERSGRFLLLCAGAPLAAWAGYAWVLSNGGALRAVAAVSVLSALLFTAGVVALGRWVAGWRGDGPWSSGDLATLLRMALYGVPLGLLVLPDWHDENYLVQAFLGAAALLLYGALLVRLLTQRDVQAMVFRR